ncbi:MAG: glycosyltransferase, partial [Deltaproteobacteria bacterium]
MKILHVNTFAAGGGAARAVSRLRKGFREIGVETRLLVQSSSSPLESGTICKQKIFTCLTADFRRHLDAIPVRFSPKGPVTGFAPAIVPDRFSQIVARLAPDIVHLHWLGAGFCRLESLARINRPLVWTLHDMWAFTGGCFYAGECNSYREKCGNCPQLGSGREVDLSRKVWQRKARSWEKLDLTVVTPSHWLAQCTRESSLLKNRRIEVIPNALETDIFQPLDIHSCRRRLKLPKNKKFILFGAINATIDSRKGYRYLQQALKTLSQEG